MLRLRLLPAVTALGLAALLMTGFSGIARADTILHATLTNGKEPQVPTPVNPTLQNGNPRPVSFGTANFVLNDAQTELSFTATVFNIDVTGTQTADPNDNLTAAHIHAAALVNPPQAVGVVWGFFGTPFNNNNPTEPMGLIPFATGVGGVFSGTWNLPEGQNTTLAAQLPNILSGNSYINFHTVQFGGGEIRGELSVPEPASILLLLAGTIGMAGVLRKHA